MLPAGAAWHDAHIARLPEEGEMNALQTCVLSMLLCGQAPAPESEPTSREALLQDFLREARAYEIRLLTDYIATG